MKYMLPANTHLYRYDLVEPPVEWSTEYKSIEYQYLVHGCKNRIGAFFFFDSKYQAVRLLRQQLRSILDVKEYGLQSV